MIDKNGRLFSKVSVVDIFILLALFVSVFGFYYKMHSQDAGVDISSNSDIKVTFKMENVRSFAVDAAVLGDEIYEQNGPYLGKIIDVFYKAHADIVETNDGRKVLGNTEGKYDLFITIGSKGKITENGYYLNGTRVVATGSEIKIESSRLSGDTVISDVTG